MEPTWDRVGTDSVDRAAKLTLAAMMRGKESKMTVSSRVKVSRVELMEHIEKWRDAEISSLNEKLQEAEKWEAFIEKERAKAKKSISGFTVAPEGYYHNPKYDCGVSDNTIVVSVTYSKTVDIPKGLSYSSSKLDSRNIKRMIDDVTKSVARDLALLELSKDEVVTISAKDYGMYF